MFRAFRDFGLAFAVSFAFARRPTGRSGLFRDAAGSPMAPRLWLRLPANAQPFLPAGKAGKVRQGQGDPPAPQDRRRPLCSLPVRRSSARAAVPASEPRRPVRRDLVRSASGPDVRQSRRRFHRDDRTLGARRAGNPGCGSSARCKVQGGNDVFGRRYTDSFSPTNRRKARGDIVPAYCRREAASASSVALDDRQLTGRRTGCAARRGTADWLRRARSTDEDRRSAGRLTFAEGPKALR